MWLAGGGIKGGITYGATDELGYNAVENVVHVHDLHATMLHLLGIDHERLTYRYQGRDFRLTDVAGKVVKGFWREVMAHRALGACSSATEAAPRGCADFSSPSSKGQHSACRRT